eukprot:gnl/TRDRNA2_/TRDRNA2_196046_c0_seq1.p1 gnl/TRDRNA2_/TRDRNA2_196046_c0~~gnl/TRDRNA2_/TRDRNA2_196046_c0_seq1.p1  ORF type:complete len:429 (-),score=52.51 gnl/TRDRNA2_/TRDRNA2_196046_c0_seq1:112-1344(-)
MVPRGLVEGMGIFDGYPEPLMAGPQHYGGGSATGSRGPVGRRDDAEYTTIMLRNIPNKYTRSMLIEQLHRAGFHGDIDYLYLPTDFANRCNVGYCFVNFRTGAARARFVNSFDGVAAQSCLPGFNSYKVCQVTRAKWQGRDENIRRLRSGPELMAQLAAHPEWLPLLIDEQGNQEPFSCDEAGAPGARGPAAPRRTMRNKKQAQGMPNMPPGQMDPEGWMPGLADMLDVFPSPAISGGGRGGRGAGVAGFPGMAAMGMPAGGAQGRRRRGGRGQQAQMDAGVAAYAEMSAQANAAYAGFGGAGLMPMAMPMMTDQGVQYLPYDSYEGAYVLAYPAMGQDTQMYYHVPYGSAAGGYAAWPGAEGTWDGFPAAAFAPGPGGSGAGRGRGAKGGRKQRRGGGAAGDSGGDPSE